MTLAPRTMVKTELPLMVSWKLFTRFTCSVPAITAAPVAVMRSNVPPSEVPPRSTTVVAVACKVSAPLTCNAPVSAGCAGDTVPATVSGPATVPWSRRAAAAATCTLPPVRVNALADSTLPVWMATCPAPALTAAPRVKV